MLCNMELEMKWNEEEKKKEQKEKKRKETNFCTLV